MDVYDNVNPLDYRYYPKSKSYEQLRRYFSENARIKYQLRVEEALVKVLAKRRVCSKKVADEVSIAIKKVKTEEVYEEEKKSKHDIKALVNAIKKKVSKNARPFVHLTATSFDIISTSANLRLKEGVLNIVLPELKKLEKTLINIALREKSTLQIGRTHGQHAEPITFGFAICEYVSRLGKRILELEKAANNLPGKMSGAVGAYNASNLFFSNPETFEKDVLKELKLQPASHSTQIVEPEFEVDVVHFAMSAFGVLANLADDMRQLQRSEIAEIGEVFDKEQVGSSTMPHKRNPINFENAKSMFLEYVPRMVTRYLNQISEHQRDLTNSASARFIPEIMVALVLTSQRLEKVMSNLAVDKINMKKNFEKSADIIAAEPAYILLAKKGHPKAHEIVKNLTLKAQKNGESFVELFLSYKPIEKYLKKFSRKQIALLTNPEDYTGIAEKKTVSVCKEWQKKLGFK